MANIELYHGSKVANNSCCELGVCEDKDRHLHYQQQSAQPSPIIHKMTVKTWNVSLVSRSFRFYCCPFKMWTLRRFRPFRRGNHSLSSRSPLFAADLPEEARKSGGPRKVKTKSVRWDVWFFGVGMQIACGNVKGLQETVNFFGASLFFLLSESITRSLLGVITHGISFCVFL